MNVEELARILNISLKELLEEVDVKSPKSNVPDRIVKEYLGNGK